MNTHDFFTRMITLNAVGPNLSMRREGEGVKKVYSCGACDADHDTNHEALTCCPVDVFVYYLCPACNDRWENKEDAEDCCVGQQAVAPLQCPVCLKEADSFEDAADCCLHTHPTLTTAGRARIVEALESGATWIEAISTNTFL